MCLFRIWLTLIDFFIECKCLSHIMITTTIQRSWMKQKTETAFFCIASKAANQHLFIYLNIRTATKRFIWKCQVWRCCINFYKIRKFQIHIVRFALSAFCGMRWMNQHTWLDMIAVIDWLEFQTYDPYIRTKLCHPFRNGTFCLRHCRSTTTNNLI